MYPMPFIVYRGDESQLHPAKLNVKSAVKLLPRSLLSHDGNTVSG